MGHKAHTKEKIRLKESDRSSDCKCRATNTNGGISLDKIYDSQKCQWCDAKVVDPRVGSDITALTGKFCSKRCLDSYEQFLFRLDDRKASSSEI